MTEIGDKNPNALDGLTKEFLHKQCMMWETEAGRLTGELNKEKDISYQLLQDKTALTAENCAFKKAAEDMVRSWCWVDQKNMDWIKVPFHRMEALERALDPASTQHKSEAGTEHDDSYHD